MRNRQTEFYFSYVIAGPVTRGGTIIAPSRAEAEARIPLKDGERIYSLVLDHAC